YGRTETIMNNLNPDFVKTFTIHYFFEEVQKLKFQVYDIDSKSTRLQDHDFIGETECTLGSIVGENGGRLEKLLLSKEHKKSRGKIIGKILIKVSVCFHQDVVTIQFRGQKLDKKDFFGKSDPFLVFYRYNEDSSFTAVHRTEVIKNTLNPTWKEFSIPSRALCNGDYDRAIRVECYDWDRDGGHDLIGIFSTTLRELTSNPNMSFEVGDTSWKKGQEKELQEFGNGESKVALFGNLPLLISILHSKVEQQPTFLDYIRGGVQINFIVAIDFTASNGDPRNSNSLHYLNPYETNLYVKALSSVGAICEDYDTDKMFPALGFGAKIPPHWGVSHEFPLNGLPQNPFCDRVEGVIAAYYQSIQNVRLYGKTNQLCTSDMENGQKASERNLGKRSPINDFTKLLNQSNFRYFVLLILTDGIISDMEQTKAAIVEAASLPISIIIVGIGPAEFDAMEVLDGDSVRLSSRGRYAERDIVQFVPFRDFLTRGAIAQDLLAKEVLEEVPDQLLSYMKNRGFKPKPVRPVRPVAVNDVTPIVGPPTNSSAPYPVDQSHMAMPQLQSVQQ
ncbi:hypothetical protein QZH41_011890, partial [Actinostola sp. cb2023]